MNKMNKIIYKVGDKVRIRKDLNINTSDRVIIVRDMMKYTGSVATIVRRTGCSYQIDIDNEKYFWCDDLFEDYVKKKINVGDTVYYLFEGKKKYGKVYKIEGVNIWCKKWDYDINKINKEGSEGFMPLSKVFLAEKENKIKKSVRTKKIKQIINEINSKPVYKRCFTNVSKEINKWSDSEIINYKLGKCMN